MSNQKKIFKKFNFFRKVKHLKHKILRLKDPPESISIGLAWGAAVSFTPLLGLHIIICFLGTYLMRGNMLAAAAGTIIGNPWTFPIIFFIGYRIGCFFGISGVENIEIILTFDFFLENFYNFFLPTFFGCIPLAISVWIITYKTSKYILLKKKYEKKKN